MSSQLGTLLRTHRERVAPEDVGLPRGPRRRTPGLRRSELATLAGVSVEYLTRLEQGRDRHPSPQVLGALADALRMSGDDRMILLMASKGVDGSACVAQPPSSTVRQGVREVLERLEPSPAVLLNRLDDVLAVTATYRTMFEPFGLFDDEHANLARFVFTDPRARDAYPDWDRVADRQVAALRRASAPGDAHLTELADLLTVVAGGAFSERFSAPLLAQQGPDLERVAHPVVGELHLQLETLTLDADGQRLVVHVAADEATSAALDALAGRRPGALRALA